eukprot:sb/3471850/
MINLGYLTTLFLILPSLSLAKSCTVPTLQQLTSSNSYLDSVVYGEIITTHRYLEYSLPYRERRKCGEEIAESAYCNVRDCDVVFDPLTNRNTEVNTYLIVDECKSVSTIPHTRCTELCDVGSANKPTSWHVSTERFICPGSTKLHYRAIMVVTECACVEDDLSLLDDPFAALDGFR